MGLPSPEVLLAPVTCMPAWAPKFASLPNTVVSSGCGEANGNVTCDPARMAKDASYKLGVTISLEAYTLARYITTEVGTRSVTERVAVAQDALNRVRYIETGTKNILNLLLYRQPAGHPNRGFYGPIHGRTGTGVDVGTAPYGRWAATSRDPTVSNLFLSIAILDGDIPRDFNKGADDQYGPEILIQRNGLTSMQNGIRSKGARNNYWVGPLPGVDHMRTFQYRTLKNVSPTSPMGKALIERGVLAVASGRPNWDGLPICAGFDPKQAVVLGTSAVIVAGAGFVAARILGRRFLGV